jgi:putative nucleotidyltransferase with HDIG domain
LDKSAIEELQEIVKERLANWPSRWEGYHWPGYTWEHTLRVRYLALKLAREVGAGEEVVDIAALLHDIEKPVGGDHASAGAQTARRLLEERHCQAEVLEAAVSAIATHAGANTAGGPLESLALGDADMIDANFGLVGTWRFITIRAGHGSDVEETIGRISSWLRGKEEMVHRLLLPAARDLAVERIAHSRVFCSFATRALKNGRDSCILEMVRHINAEHTRGSLIEQLPALEKIAREANDAAAIGICRRLEDEAAGRF